MSKARVLIAECLAEYGLYRSHDEWVGDLIDDLLNFHTAALEETSENNLSGMSQMSQASQENGVARTILRESDVQDCHCKCADEGSVPWRAEITE